MQSHGSGGIGSGAPSRAEQAGETTERLPLLALVLQAAILPLLGIPIWFRNEAPYHYVYCREIGFLDSWRTYTPAISRPVVRVVEWLECYTFGTNADLYVLFNGLLFVLFALVMARLTATLFGRLAAWLSVLILLGAWSLVFYPLYNALHGVEYPLELLLATGAVLLLHTGLAGDARRFAAGIFLGALAALTHSMSLAILPPVLVAALIFASPARTRLLGPRGRLAVLLLAPCALLLMPIVQRSGAPGGLFAQGGLGGSIRFALGQAAALDAQAMRAPAGPLLLWGAFFLALGGRAARPAGSPARGAGPDVVAALPPRRILALAGLSLAAALVLTAIGPGVPGARLAILLAALAAAAVRDRRHAFLAVWAFAGAGLFLLTTERNASYYRHLAVPTAVMLGGAFAAMLDAAAGALPVAPALRRAIILPRAALATAVLTTALVVAARATPVPVLSARLADLDYVKDLSFTFRDLVARVAREAAPGDTLLMYRGPTREEESRELYGAAYLARLQPSKFPYYEWYFRLFGRADLHVAAVEDRAADPERLRGLRLLAVNAWEIERTIQDRGDRPEVEVQRGRARAALFAP